MKYRELKLLSLKICNAPKMTRDSYSVAGMVEGVDSHQLPSYLKDSAANVTFPPNNIV